MNESFLNDIDLQSITIESISRLNKSHIQDIKHISKEANFTMNSLLPNEFLDSNKTIIFKEKNPIPPSTTTSFTDFSKSLSDSDQVFPDNSTTTNFNDINDAESSDDLLQMCGDGGIWQIMVLFLGSVCGFNCAYENFHGLNSLKYRIQNFIYTFIADPPDHWCLLPLVEDVYSNSNVSDSDLKELLIPKDQTGSFEKCFHYRYEINDGEIKVNTNYRERCTVKHYEQLNFGETIASEWDLVCENSFWLSSIQAAYMFGVMLGSVIFGLWSDKFGRKNTIWISSLQFYLCSHLVALAPNFISLVLFRFLLGCSSPGVFSASYVLVVEATGSTRRALVGSLFNIPFCVGYMMLPVIAYFIRDWRYLQLTCSCLSSLLLLTWWYTPESPRWLLLQGRASEAEKVFITIAEMNGKKEDLPKHFSELFVKIAAAERQNANKKTCIERCGGGMSALFRLLKTPRIRFRTISMCVSFTSISLIYYGIAINATNLGFDKYLFTFLCGLFGIPAALMTPMLINTVGRRLSFSCLFLCVGLFLLLSLLFSNGSSAIIILAVLAQLFISTDSSISYLYSSELFPTVLRNYALGISSMVGRTGSIAAPYIVDLLGENHRTFPTIIFGTAAIIAGSLTFFLPETKNKKLPETIEEVEKLNFL